MGQGRGQARTQVLKILLKCEQQQGHRAPRPYLLLVSGTPRGEQGGHILHQGLLDSIRLLLRSWAVIPQPLFSQPQLMTGAPPGSVLMCAHVAWPGLVSDCGSHTESAGNVGPVAMVLG